MSEENNIAPKGEETPANDTGVKPIPSPNENHADDENLDSNGNPIAEQVKPVVEQKEEPKPNVVEDIKEAAKGIEGFLTDAGLTPADVAKAVSENDGMTPEIMKALVDKHGESVAELIAEKITGIHSNNKTQAKEKDKAIFDQVHEAFNDPQGGEETFKELAKWAKENVDNTDRVEINKMLEQGGYAAKLAISDLISKFKDSENFTQPANLEIADNLADSHGAKPLNKTEYNREMRTLRDKGHVYGKSPKMQALDKRREAGMKRGI